MASARASSSDASRILAPSSLPTSSSNRCTVCPSLFSSSTFRAWSSSIFRLDAASAALARDRSSSTSVSNAWIESTSRS